MEVIELNNKKQLNSFIASRPQAQFLQSFEWGEFQESAGNKVIRLGVEEKGELIAAASLIKKPLLLGRSYFYCPRGPILILDLRSKILDLLFKEIKKIVKREKAIFLRFEPNFQISQFPNFPISKTIDVQPSKTLILDLTKEEDELLKEMHQKTRYNIRLAKKRGVKIVEVENSANKFGEFWYLMNETKHRDGFRVHSHDYYEKMLAIDFVKLFLAEYKNEIIAAGIFSFFGDTAVYMHGASSNKYRNVMAPYLLQWQAIKKAKELGFKYYDFYGIGEKKWPGVTRFKKGFSGEEIEYPGTFDLVFKPSLYNIYNVLRNLRRKL